MDATLSFVLATLALTGSPGPNTLSLAAVGASFGRIRGLGYMIGVDLGMMAVIVIVGTGLAGVVMTLPMVAPAITFLAAAYFVWLAYRIATAPPVGSESGPRTDAVPRWYAGVTLSLVNPKAYAAMTAMFSGHVLVQGNQIADSIWKGALLLGIIILVNVAWLSLGAGLTRLLRDRRMSRIVNVGFAALLLISVAFAIL